LLCILTFTYAFFSSSRFALANNKMMQNAVNYNKTNVNLFIFISCLRKTLNCLAWNHEKMDRGLWTDILKCYTLQQEDSTAVKIQKQVWKYLYLITTIQYNYFNVLYIITSDKGHEMAITRHRYRP